MKIALLNVPVTFQENAVTVDAIGNHKNEWADYYSCHATVSGEDRKDTSESSTAGTTVDNSDISFTIRYCRKAATINSTQYRVVFEGEFYDILAVDHMNFKRKALKFKCRKARR